MGANGERANGERANGASECVVIHTRRATSQMSAACGARAPRACATRDARRRTNRRDALRGVAAAIVATCARAERANASVASEKIKRGAREFIRGDVRGAIDAFDDAIASDERFSAYMWQRGLALYYAGAYEEAAKQFRLDVAQNPNDTEESVWCFASEAMDPEKGIAYARENMLITGRDSRPVMSSVFALFAEGSEEAATRLREAGRSNASDEFYSALYLGLFYEINGDEERARREIERANRTAYARLSGDYMTDVARVHAKTRSWS